MYANQAPTVKDMCYLRLTKMVNAGGMSFAEKVTNRLYMRQDIKHALTVEVEFLEECAVLRFKDLPNGGKKLLTKKEMNARLGKDRSMDLLDPCAMRMYPCANIPYGEELDAGFDGADESRYIKDDSDKPDELVNVFDDTTWC